MTTSQYPPEDRGQGFTQNLSRLQGKIDPDLLEFLRELVHSWEAISAQSSPTAVAKGMRESRAATWGQQFYMRPGGWQRGTARRIARSVGLPEQNVPMPEPSESEEEYRARLETAAESRGKVVKDRREKAPAPKGPGVNLSSRFTIPEEPEPAGPETFAGQVAERKAWARKGMAERKLFDEATSALRGFSGSDTPEGAMRDVALGVGDYEALLNNLRSKDPRAAQRFQDLYEAHRGGMGLVRKGMM